MRELHGLIWNETSHVVCTADEERFATVQERARIRRVLYGLIRTATERHGPVTIIILYIQKMPSGFRIQGSDPGQRDPLVLELY